MYSMEDYHVKSSMSYPAAVLSMAISVRIAPFGCLLLCDNVPSLPIVTLWLGWLTSSSPSSA